MLTLAISATTWYGWPSVPLAIASVLSTYAMFYMRGRALRCAMVMVSALWMHHAWSCGSWEQVVANVITAAAALRGAWRIERSVAHGTSDRLRLDWPATVT